MWWISTCMLVCLHHLHGFIKYKMLNKSKTYVHDFIPKCFRPMQLGGPRHVIRVHTESGL